MSPVAGNRDETFGGLGDHRLVGARVLQHQLERGELGRFVVRLARELCERAQQRHRVGRELRGLEQIRAGREEIACHAVQLGAAGEQLGPGLTFRVHDEAREQIEPLELMRVVVGQQRQQP